MVPSILDEKYVIRFCVNAINASEDHMIEAWTLIQSHADTILKQKEVETVTIEEETISLPPAITSKLRRLRFGISKMVSDPRNYNQRRYKRTATSFRITSDSGKYLARKCSIVEKTDDDI